MESLLWSSENESKPSCLAHIYVRMSHGVTSITSLIDEEHDSPCSYNYFSNNFYVKIHVNNIFLFFKNYF